MQDDASVLTGLHSLNSLNSLHHNGSTNAGDNDSATNSVSVSGTNSVSHSVQGGKGGGGGGEDDNDNDNYSRSSYGTGPYVPDLHSPYGRKELSFGKDTSHDHPVGFGHLTSPQASFVSGNGSMSMDGTNSLNSHFDDSILICGNLLDNSDKSVTSNNTVFKHERGLNTALSQTTKHGKFIAGRASAGGEHHKYGLGNKIAMQKANGEGNGGDKTHLLDGVQGDHPNVFINPELNQMSLMTQSMGSLTTNTLQLSQAQHAIAEPLPSELLTPQQQSLANIAALKAKNKDKHKNMFGQGRAKDSTEIEWSSLAGTGGAGVVKHLSDAVATPEKEKLAITTLSTFAASGDAAKEETGEGDNFLVSPKERILPTDRRFDKDGNLIHTKHLTVSNLTGEKPPGGTGRGGGTSTNATFYKPGYNDAVADHIHVLTDKHAGNPFRPTPEQSLHEAYKANSSVAVTSSINQNVNTNLQTNSRPNQMPNPRNPLVYRPEVTYSTAGGISLVVKNDRTTGGRVLTGAGKNKHDRDPTKGMYLMNPQNGEIALNDIPTRGEVHRALSQV